VSTAAERSDGDTDVDVLVVGAGQAGLGTGYWLARRTSLSFLIVDGAERIGDSWRRRWDSLVLFTPRRFSSLPGTPMPRGPGEYASKDDTADYLAGFAQLAVELAASHRVTVAAPGGMWFLPARVLGVSPYWWLWLSGILNGRSSSRVSRLVRARGDGIIGRDLQALVAAGTVRMVKERVCGAKGRTVLLSDGTQVRADAVLWCTGYRPDHGWLRVPGALDDQGWPVHDAGRPPVLGLHWVGLPWQTRLNSGIIDGIDRDARRTVRRIATEQSSGTACARPATGGARLPRPGP